MGYKRIKVRGKIKQNSNIPRLLSWFISIKAITIWPFIFIKDSGHEELINHERIHLKQQEELLLVGFYLLYMLFWIIGLIKFRNFHKAYINIPFEKEAYDNESNWIFLLNRPRNNWINYL
jgi:beta-lactamase regulating signal transducer with metallopeptidase domain